MQEHVMHDIKDCKREVLHCRMTKIIGSMEHTLAIQGKVRWLSYCGHKRLSYAAQCVVCITQIKRPQDLRIMKLKILLRWEARMVQYIYWSAGVKLGRKNMAWVIRGSIVCLCFSDVHIYWCYIVYWCYKIHWCYRIWEKSTLQRSF